MKHGTAMQSLSVRQARTAETDFLRHLYVSSLWCVGMRDHAVADIEAYLGAFPGVDADLVASGRYFVAEVAGHVVGGGGWSPTAEACAAGAALVEAAAADALLPPDSAIVRGFFVYDSVAEASRLIMRRIECDAALAGHPLAIVVASRAAAMIHMDPNYRDIRPLPLQVAEDRVLQLLQLSKRIGGTFAAVA